jgi:hypothetical protein
MFGGWYHCFSQHNFNEEINQHQEYNNEEINQHQEHNNDNQEDDFDSNFDSNFESLRVLETGVRDK